MSAERIVLLLEPAGGLAEALCRVLAQRGGIRVVAVGSNLAHGAALSQGLAAERISLNWRFVDPHLSSCLSGLVADLSAVYGRVDRLVCFSCPASRAASLTRLGATPGIIWRIAEPHFKLRLQLLRRLTPLLASGHARVLNLYLGLRNVPDAQRSVPSHVAEMLDDMLNGAWRDNGIEFDQIGTWGDRGLNLTAMRHIQDDLQRVLRKLRFEPAAG